MENNVHEDEISLKELIQSLLKHWKLITVITAAALAFAGLYGWVIASPTYESTMEGIINVHESASTKYGGYPFPTRNKMDFLSVVHSEIVLTKTINDFELDTTYDRFVERITIENEEGSNTFSFILTGEDPVETKEMVEKLTDNFLNELSLFYREKAIDHFIKSYTLSLTNYEEEETRLNKRIADTQELLETVEPTITLKKLVASDPVLAAEILNQEGKTIEDISDDMMIEEVINPHYNSLQGEAIALQKDIDGLYIARDKIQRFLAELRQEKSNLMTYRQNPEGELVGEGSLDVMDRQIYVNSSATLPINPIAPRKMMIIAIAGVLGLMLGVFTAFFIEYWKKS